MSSQSSTARHNAWLWASALLTFFLLLGARGLNEPDEGRYGEIAREMLETGNWLVPHIWYVPHLDKPPLTYWAVAGSMAVFGEGEWAVRLPLALAGLSGLAAVYCFARLFGGRRGAVWAVLILQSSLLYWAMARMLTTDIFLTQFIAWAFYFGWRSWRSMDDLEAADELARVRSARACFRWQLAAWTALALGFLTKGPVALAVPLASWAAFLVLRRPPGARWQTFLLSNVAGLVVFNLLVLPWFVAVFQSVPGAFDYMVRGQVVGHALGTSIKNRGGPPWYYAGILAVGWLPWTVLIGWLWRGDHWRQLNQHHKDGWLLLSIWAGFTFVLFSLARAKLPAYILPLFPALALLTSFRWFRYGDQSCQPSPPLWVWRVVLLSPLVLMTSLPLVVRVAFKVSTQPWQLPLAIGGGVMLLAVAYLTRNWSPRVCARGAFGLALVSFGLMAWLLPTIEDSLRSNQTLKPLAVALREHFSTGDRVVCWGRFPQGLPFYAHPAISPTERPYLGGMPFHQIPFEFPGNRERLSDRLLPQEADLDRLMGGSNRVFVVGFKGTYQATQARLPQLTLPLLLQSGQWELFANR